MDPAPQAPDPPAGATDAPAPRPPSRSAAFFDLDRTLISGSSTFPFGVGAWRAGLVPTRELARDAVGALVFRLVGASDERSEKLRDRILTAVAGEAQSDLHELGHELMPKLLGKVRPEAKGLIEMHHQAGRHTYVISAAPAEIVEPLATALGLDGGIGTVAEVVDGRYTGELVGPFCYGPGKAEAIEKLAAERGYELPLCYSYSDSVSDLPMLELAGHPVAVNPDAGLEEIAHQRGWPIVIFSRRAKQVVKATTALTGAVGLAGATYALGRRHGRIHSEAIRGRGLLR